MSLTVTSDRDEIEKHPTGRTSSATDLGPTHPTAERADAVSLGNGNRTASRVLTDRCEKLVFEVAQVSRRDARSDCATVPDNKGQLYPACGDDHVVRRRATIWVFETGDHNQPAWCVSPDFGVGGQPPFENCPPSGHAIGHSCNIDCRTSRNCRRSRSNVGEVVSRSNTSPAHRVHHHKHRALSASTQWDSHIRNPVSRCETWRGDLSIPRAQRPERHVQPNRRHRKLFTS